LFVVALIFAAAAAPAAADTTLVPRDGQVWTASEPHELVVYASDYAALPAAFAFAVATSPATGADGLLADPIARAVAPAQPAHPGIYAAPVALATPGTYYWQAAYADDDGDTYASAIHTLTIVAPPPPDAPAPPVALAPPVAPPPAATPRPPDVATVRIAVRRAIHAATRRVARGLVYRCTRAPAAATCRPSWHDVRFGYRGTLRLSFAASPIAATFTGTRRLRGHARARAVTWATSV
jgi:hypothetical protein